MGMGEIDVDEIIKNYWQRRCAREPIDENSILQEFDAIVKEIREITFKNPDSRENSGRAARFFRFLDLEPIMPIINKYYKVEEGSETYPRRGMVKAMFWRRVMGFNFTKEYTHLKNHPEDTKDLGLVNEFGDPIVPNWRTLRHFENERLKLEGQNDLRRALVRAVRERGQELGENIGEDVAIDGMPIETFPKDKDGKWNPHYQRKMVKGEILGDVSHTLPLAATVAGGTDNDGEYGNQLLNKAAAELGVETMKHLWIDGGFTSDKNLAEFHVNYNFEGIYYHITETWTLHKRFEHWVNGEQVFFEPDEEIEWQYQKLWKEPYYIPNASFEYKMKCLIKAGIYEPVAAYFRNDYCTKYEEAPDSTLDVYHRRNVEEGFHGILKTHYHLEDYLDRRGRKNLERTLIGCINAALAVALTRLQHGVKENLVSTAYMT